MYHPNTPVPDYWKSTLEDVELALKLVKRGKVSTIASSAGGRPVYQVEYGCSNLKPGSANLASALGAFDYKYFADKTGEDYVPTLLLDGCIHGGEFEGTVAILNLIKLMETGTDYAGNAHPQLMEIMEKLHLFLIPVSNPDGRSRFPFRSAVGMTMKEFRYYNQGAWKDGSLCDWPGCKAVHPIKDHVSYLGGYFNDDGINMMHEDYFGKASAETSALFDICRAEAPDFSLLLHGGTNCTSCLIPYEYTTPASRAESIAVSHKIKAHCDHQGLRYKVFESYNFGDGFMLCSAMHHLCGGVVITYESNQGLVEAIGEPYTYDEIYRSHLILFEETGKYLLEKYAKGADFHDA